MSDPHEGELASQTIKEDIKRHDQKMKLFASQRLGMCHKYLKLNGWSVVPDLSNPLLNAYQKGDFCTYCVNLAMSKQDYMNVKSEAENLHG